MKCVYVIGLLLIGASLCQARASGTEEELQNISGALDEEQLKAIVLSVIKNKCDEEKADVTNEQILKALSNAKTCLEGNVPKNAEQLRNLEESSDDICSDKRGSIRKCFEDLIDVLKECSDPEEKYLPDFVFNAVDGVLDYICANNSAVVLKLYDDTTFDCLDSLSRKEVVDACEDKFTLFKEEAGEDSVITKTELCEVLDSTKTCYGQFLVKQCPNATDLKNALSDLYKIISKPCKTSK